MNQKQKPQQPPLYRLTLSRAAYFASAEAKRIFKPQVPFERSDGKVDVGIPHSTLDQLQTAARPKENLSDTVLRILGGNKNG